MGASYDIDDKFGVSASVQEVVTTFSGGGNQGGVQGQGDQVTSVNTSLYYHLSDKISIGPSLNAGIDKPDNAPQDTFEQGLLGLAYQPTEKIGLFAQAGLELRQTDGSNQDGQNNQNNNNNNDTNPVFSAGLSYTPFDSTSINVGASQSIHSSAADAGQAVLSTDVSCSVTQRFFQRLFLNLSYGYSHSDDSTARKAYRQIRAAARQLQLPWLALISPTGWTSVAVYYQYWIMKRARRVAVIMITRWEFPPQFSSEKADINT